MKSFFLRTLLCVLLPVTGHAQVFTSFLELISTAPLEERPSMVDAFTSRNPTSPLFDSDTVAVFVYTGPAASVSIAGDMNGWRTGVDTMTSIPGTDLWYQSRFFERDARLDYKFVIDGSSWILDPRNDLISRGGFGSNSEIRMPGYDDHPELTRNAAVPRGSIRDTVFFSATLGNERNVSIYVPADYDGETDSLRMVLVHDGLEFVSLARMPVVVDNLIADGLLPPVLIIFIPPFDRTSEYAGDRMDPFVFFIVNEVIPAIRTQYRIRSDPADHVVMGASNGGNIALYLGVTHPNMFGNVAAFSSNVLPSITERFTSDARLRLRIYLDIGTYDIPQLVPKVRELRTLLEKNGYELRYSEHHDGHSWANWRSHIDDALIFLLSETDRH